MQFKLSSGGSAINTNAPTTNFSNLAETETETREEFSQHSWWEPGTNWKSALNNLRLILQPYIFWCLIEPWCQVFQISGLKRGFSKLIEIMNNFRASPIKPALTN